MSQLQAIDQALASGKELTRDEWLDYGRRLGALQGALNWRLGDWLAYGMGRGEFGDTYALAEEVTGRSLATLSQCHRVSEAFPPGLRWDTRGISWTVHREVLRIPKHERQTFLEMIHARKLTRMQIVGLLAGTQRATIAVGDGGKVVREVPPVDRKVVQAVSRWRKDGKPPAEKHQVRCPHCRKIFGVRRKALDGGPVETFTGVGDGSENRADTGPAEGVGPDPDHL